MFPFAKNVNYPKIKVYLVFVFVLVLERDETEQMRMEREVEEESHREVYNEVDKTLDFRKVRVTDMKDNPRVVLPPPRPPQEEAVLTAKELLWNEAIQDYSRKNCRKGCQKTNLSKKEEAGIKKLELRKKSGEVVIIPTDKSGRMSISSRESYTKQGDVHTKGDKIVSWKEIEEAKTELVRHSKALGNVFRMGENWGESGES